MGNYRISSLIKLVLLLNLPAMAQLSPGDLSRSHAFLEGLANCTKCHSVGKQITAENCLSCHKILGERIVQGKGLHANAEFRNCFECHSEHHGRKFELIYWKEGLEAFDHRKTGYLLEGAHQQLQCRDCHTEKNIVDKPAMRAVEKDLNRTFLGLSANCVSCHQDEHRGQLGSNCLDCHTNEVWKPAAGFNHDKTRFPLTGQHRDVKCEACHSVQRDKPQADDPTYLKFSNMRFSQCSSCHTDPHKGSFGANCKSCHQTDDWQKVKGGSFDHDKTRFPLKGKHNLVACESCHLPGQSKRGIAFANCTDCHGDVHEGQFSARTSGGECSECHTVEGFRPSGFTAAEHARTDFPLEGAHLAVPCFVCHTGAQSMKADRGMISMNHFTFQSTNCRDCHQDPHLGQVDKMVADAAGGCLYCHQVETWRQISFDHAITEFVLEGRHSQIACSECHRPVTDEQGVRSLPFDTRTKLCVGCHEDIHDRQFDRVLQVQGREVADTDCRRCHTPQNWTAANFDHNRDSRFSLEGAHQETACISCHKIEPGQKLAEARFKPLDTRCQNCHGGGQSEEGP